MIAFGACVESRTRFERVCLPGLRRVAEPDSILLTSTSSESIFRAYNEIVDEARANPDVEALVLLHEDLELQDHRFCGSLRAVLANPRVAIAGPIGASAPHSIAWWEAEPRGRVAESRGLIDFGPGPADVDVLDGLLLALSRWAVDHLRFDEETFTGFHAYDMDICMQARAAGRLVRILDTRVHHRTKGGVGDAKAFARADAAWREKWRDVIPPASARRVAAAPRSIH